jgi:nucleotide-binding universal stress UspA family protein
MANPGYSRILVPIDGSVAADAGLREAIKLASLRRGATIRLLHVLEPLPALQGRKMVVTGPLLESMTALGEEILENAKALVERNGIRAETVFQRRSQKRAAEGIEREARRWKPDILVMGTNGQRALSREVLGSDAETVARSVTVPILLVRAPGLPFAISPRRKAPARARAPGTRRLS